MIEQFLSPAVVDALGWTLLHTLWQGALFALLLGLVLILLRAFSPQARYYVACGFLGAFLLTVGMTFYKAYSGAFVSDFPAVAAADPGERPTTAGSPFPSPAPEPREAATAEETASPLSSFLAPARQYFDRHLPLIVTLWLMGVLVLQLRLLGQLAWVQRVKTYGTERFPTSWAERVQELEHRLDIRRPVRYLTSQRVQGPFTAGWLRPVILLPREMLAELRESQLVTILAHELAHIKRQDFAVNVLQTFLTTFFFYHPGVWWMSGRIEDEREHCCDDLAIAATGERVDYARTLVQLQERELKTPGMSVAFGGTGFSGRIRRLLTGYLGTATFSEGVITTLIFGAVLALAFGTTGDLQALNAQPEPVHSPESPAPALAAPQTERTVRGELAPFNQQTPMKTLQEGHGDDAFDLLMHAINDGDYEMVKYLLERVDDLSRVDDRGFTPLMAAASENRVEITRLLIDRGANVNQVHRQWTALIEAADEGALEVAELLLDAGAAVNLMGGSGRSAAAMAASEGHLDVLKLLVARGAHLGKGSGLVPPLHLAANEGQLEIVANLLEQGIDVDLPDGHGRTALAYAVSEDQSEVTKLLLEAGADPDKLEEHGYSVIRFGDGEGEAEQVRKATLKTGDAAVERLMRTPEILLGPAGEGILLTVEAMLEMGIDVNIEDGEGNTALSNAARGGHLEVVQLLLERGAGVQGSGRTYSPLYLAARNGHPRIVEALIHAGARTEDGSNFDVIQRQERNTYERYRGATPLLAAVRSKHLGIVHLLLSLGADPNATTARTSYLLPDELTVDELSQLRIAEVEGRYPVRYRTDEWTALLQAVESGDPRLIRQLLEEGADPNHRTPDGLTALALARQLGHDEIVRLLK